MGRNISARIGFGYIISTDDFPIPDEEDFNTYEEYDDAYEEYDAKWRIPLIESGYFMFFDDYNYSDVYFFGIIIQETEWYTPLKINEFMNTFPFDEWQKCENVFHKFFPDLKKDPTTYLLAQDF